MSNENKPRLNCEIVGDLLPLYHDEVLSDSGREAVAEHLAACTRCKKNYESLCKELSAEHEVPATQERFQAMMRRLKRKRIGVMVLTALLSCGILGGGYAALTRIPLKELTAEDVKIVRAYRYTGEDGDDRMFLLRELSFWDYEHTQFRQASDDSKTMELTVKVPLIGAKHPELGTRWMMDCWDIPEEMTQAEFQELPFWTETENGEDAVPEYVYAYDSHEFDFWITSEEEGYVGAQYEDGTQIYWDLDGNVCEKRTPNLPELDAEGNESMALQES